MNSGQRATGRPACAPPARPNSSARANGSRWFAASRSGNCCTVRCGGGGVAAPCGGVRLACGLARRLRSCSASDRRHQFRNRRVDAVLDARTRRAAAGRDRNSRRRAHFGRHHIGDHARARINADADPVIVVARDDDRIAVRIDAADYADMTAALAAPKHRDRADTRLGNAVSVIGEGLGGVGIGAGIAEPYAK